MLHGFRIERSDWLKCGMDLNTSIPGFKLSLVILARNSRQIYVFTSGNPKYYVVGNGIVSALLLIKQLSITP
jgi:hypothetical protein